MEKKNSLTENRLVGLVVEASASTVEGPRNRFPLASWDFFRGRVLPVTSTLALQWLPCQAPGVIGSVHSGLCYTQNN